MNALDFDELAVRLRRKQDGHFIGDRTAADLRHGLPPDQLVDLFLTAEGPTVIYAKGGTGKGIMTCWFVLRLVRAGHVVMLLDFEYHEREWGSRLRGLGMTVDELSKVHYRAPYGPDWLAETGPLSVVADLVREDAERLGVTYIVVDSYTVATSTGDTMGGAPAAQEYFSGLTRIGLPSLTIAHVAGDAEKFPDKPFGSVFVHNLARETWAVAPVGDTPDSMDPDERYGPVMLALELRNRKANDRPKAWPQFLSFSFFADGTIEVATDPPNQAIADVIEAVLADGPKDRKQIAAAIKEDTGRQIDEAVIGATLRRQRGKRFVEDTATRPRKWKLKAS